MQEYTLNYALMLWRKSKQNCTSDANFEKYLSIALRCYVLPQLDPQSRTITASDFAQYCDSFLVMNLKDALNVFEEQFALAVKNGKVSQKTGYNYRSVLQRFMGWLEKQAWWRCLFPDPVVTIAPPRVKLALKPGTGVKKLSLYGLSLEDLPDHLHQELDAFQDFRLNGGQGTHRDLSVGLRSRENYGGRKPRVKPVQPSTVKSNKERILAFLGWYTEHHLLDDLHLQALSTLQQYVWSPQAFAILTNCKGVNLSVVYLSLLKECRNKLLADLHLSLLTDPDRLCDYTYWAIETRGVSFSRGVSLLQTAIAVAKWFYYDQTARHNWSDIPVMLELQDLHSEFKEEYSLERESRQAEKWAHKELTHAEARQVVDYLRLCCAPYRSQETHRKSRVYHSSVERSPSVVARRWQTYLIVKILVYCPVRQEEIRNWQLGKTLLRKVDREGNPYYVVYLRSHKRSSTSKDRHYRLPSILTEDLDMWVYKWRPLISQMLQAPEDWMEFWGYRVDALESTSEKLANARQGQLPKKYKKTQEEYISCVEGQLSRVTWRFETWNIAKQNFDSHEFLFFKFGRNGKNNTQSFGQPHDIASIWRSVVNAIARSTKALFGEERWTNPHKLRNIAEKHIRQSGKLEIAEAFATFIGHSRKMGDEYAAQITSEYELTEGIVDNWWYEP